MTWLLLPCKGHRRHSLGGVSDVRCPWLSLPPTSPVPQLLAYWLTTTQGRDGTSPSSSTGSLALHGPLLVAPVPGFRGTAEGVTPLTHWFPLGMLLPQHPWLHKISSSKNSLIHDTQGVSAPRLHLG